MTAASDEVELATALVAAIADMPDISKGKKAKVEMKGGGSYSYNYADLGDVLTAVRAVLSKHGLAVVQDVTGLQGGMIGVSTILTHKNGGRMIFGPLPMPTGSTPQALGSAITYARRYALLAALGIATEDDDGQTARKEQHQPAPEPTYSAEVLALFERVKAAKGTPLADELKELAQSNNMKLTLDGLQRDATWAEIVTATLDGAA